MRFIEYLNLTRSKGQDILIKLPIIEQAIRRKEILDKYHNNSRQIVKHLIKLLRYIDPINERKHIRDINNWITEVADYTPKSDNICAEDIFENIFKKRFYPKNLKKFQYLIDDLDEDYGLLRTTKYNTSEIYDIIESVLKEVSDDLEHDNFISIKYYIKKFII